MIIGQQFGTWITSLVSFNHLIQIQELKSTKIRTFWLKDLVSLEHVHSSSVVKPI